ncbi:hypothetical protein Tco_1257968 [Tanacetum coccineum]
MQTMDNTPLLRTIADIFGQSKWFKAIVALIQDNNVVVVAQERLLVPKCVAMGESRPISDIGGFDIPETVSVVSGGTYTVRDDVMSKRQCIQRSDFNPLDCGPGSSVSMPELPGYSCIVDSGVSSMWSNVESASYVVTSSCLGDRILDTGYTGPHIAYRSRNCDQTTNGNIVVQF